MAKAEGRRVARPYSGSKGKGLSSLPFMLNVLVWWWAPLVLMLWWLVVKLAMPGIGSLHQDMYLFVQQHVTAGDGGVFGLATEFWVFLGFGFLFTALITLFLDNKKDMSRQELTLILTSFSLALVIFTVPVTKGIFSAVHDEANWYLQSSPVYVQEPEQDGTHPSSLELLYAQEDGPKIVLDKDTYKIGPTTIKRGGYPTHLVDFESRSAAFDGALKALEQKTSSGNKTGIFDPTVTYVYGASLNKAEGQPAAESNVAYPQTNRWSAVVDVAKADDGNFENPTVGVSEWVIGQSQVHVCQFGKGPNKDNKFDRAFGGQHMNSLRNVIYKDYPKLLWEDRDVAGYCDKDDHPIIVIATTCNVGVRNAKGNINGSVTVPAPCGILRLTGSPSGHPNIKYFPNVNEGEYPVPVYPASVMDRQLGFTSWWAGRGNFDQAGFGYSRPGNDSQAANDGNYILRNKKTGVTYAVTLQKARSSGNSERYVNWGFIQTNKVTRGKLNELSSYVLNDDDPHATDSVSLYNNGLRAIEQSGLAPNFLGNKNALVEIIPTGEYTYRGYGQNPTGNTFMYVDIRMQDDTASATVTLVDSNGKPGLSREVVVDQASDKPAQQTPPQSGQNGNQPGTTQTGPGTCAGKPVAQATDTELEACRQSGRAAEDELIARLRRNPATPTPATTP